MAHYTTDDGVNATLPCLKCFETISALCVPLAELLASLFTTQSVFLLTDKRQEMKPQKKEETLQEMTQGS